MSTRPVRIYAVGDIFLGESPYCYGFGIGSTIGRKGPDFLFRNVVGIFSDGDLVMGNLEAPVSRSSDQKGIRKNLFRAEPEVAMALKRARFTVLSLANNHIMEHGLPAFEETWASLQEAGILCPGIRSKRDLVTVNGCKICVLAYSFIPDSSEQVPYNRVRNESRIIDDIRSIRDIADLVILMLHWGEEYVSCPSPEQVTMGRTLVDNGADIIIGSHPHVLQGYEMYRNRIIVYSLGNFIFENFIRETGRGAILRIDADPGNNTFSLEYLPVTSGPEQFSPEPAGHPSREKILDLIATVHREIEGVSTLEYAGRMRDYPDVVRKYKARAKKQMKRHFMKNLYRYPLAVSLSLVKQYVKKRWK